MGADRLHDIPVLAGNVHTDKLNACDGTRSSAVPVVGVSDIDSHRTTRGFAVRVLLSETLRFEVRIETYQTRTVRQDYHSPARTRGVYAGVYVLVPRVSRRLAMLSRWTHTDEDKDVRHRANHKPHAHYALDYIRHCGDRVLRLFAMGVLHLAAYRRAARCNNNDKLRVSRKDFNGAAQRVASTQRK